MSQETINFSDDELVGWDDLDKPIWVAEDGVEAEVMKVDVGVTNSGKPRIDINLRFLTGQNENVRLTKYLTVHSVSAIQRRFMQSDLNLLWPGVFNGCKKLSDLCEFIGTVTKDDPGYHITPGKFADFAEYPVGSVVTTNVVSQGENSIWPNIQFVHWAGLQDMDSYLEQVDALSDSDAEDIAF